MPSWFPYFDSACAALAGGAWYLFPELGPWPLVVGLAPWLVRLVRTGRPTRWTGFDLPLLLFLATAGLSVWAAYDKDAAWMKFWVIVAGVLLFYAIANGLLAGVPAHRYGWGVALLGVVVTGYFLATHDWDQFPGKVAALEALGRGLQAPLPALPGYRIHPNIVGGMLALVLPFAGALVTSTKGTKGTKTGGWQVGKLAGWLGLRRLLAGGALAVIAFGLLMTTARGAWLALGGAVGLALLWWLAGFPGRVPQRWLFTGLLAAGLLVGAGIILTQTEQVVALINRLPVGDTGQGRLSFWRHSLILVQDYPLVGAGLDGFMMLYSTYAFLLHVGFITHTHNLFLDVAIEQGLLALLALAVMGGLFALALWRSSVIGERLNSQQSTVNSQQSTKNQQTNQPTNKQTNQPTNQPTNQQTNQPTNQLFLGAAALALVTVLLHGLVDDALYGSRAVLLLFLPLAFAVPVVSDRLSVTSDQLSVTSDRLSVTSDQLSVTSDQLSVSSERNSIGRSLLTDYRLLFTGALLALALAIWAVPSLRAVAVANLAAVAQSRTELAVYRWPEWPLQDQVRREVDLSGAIAGYEQALALDPGNVSANRRLGQIELSLAEYDDALAHLQVAYDAMPWDNATRQLYGEALIVTGRVEEGAALWATVNNAQNQLAARTFWYRHIGDDARLAAAQAAAQR